VDVVDTVGIVDSLDTVDIVDNMDTVDIVDSMDTWILLILWMLRAWDCRRRNKFFSGSIYFSSATCFDHSTILKREYTILKNH
jgi:hypothetical protein